MRRSSPIADLECRHGTVVVDVRRERYWPKPASCTVPTRGAVAMMQATLAQRFLFTRY